MSNQRIPLAAIFPLVLLLMLGSGAGRVRSADLPREKVLFEENFTDPPGKDWSWLRELPQHWKIDKDRHELLISPVWAEGNLKNIPLWTIPDLKDGSLAIEVHLDHVPTGEYEYAGLILYFDDNNYVAIRKGPHGDDGRILTLLQRKAGVQDRPPSSKDLIFNEPVVDLRMVIAGGKAQGWYRASSTDQWQSLGEVDLPGTGPAKVGFRTGNGDGPKPSWARFSKFRILHLDR